VEYRNFHKSFTLTRCSCKSCVSCKDTPPYLRANAVLLWRGKRDDAVGEGRMGKTNNTKFQKKENVCEVLKTVEKTKVKGKIGLSTQLQNHGGPKPTAEAIDQTT